MTTIKDLFDLWTPRFEGLFKPQERPIAQLELELLLAHTLKCDRSRLIAHFEDPMPDPDRHAFERLAERRLKHEPLAYLLGHREFYGRDFLVDNRALIPRPETEILVAHALDILKDERRQETLVWDVGTGSGAIATTVALGWPNVDLIATDIDDKAITLACQNAKRLHARSIRFLKADLLDRSVKKILMNATVGHFLILANLPYLPLSDRKTLEPEVVQYEPSHALFTGEHGLLLIQKFLHQLSDFQKSDGRPMSILLEYDPPQTKILNAIVKKYFPAARVSVYQDDCGRDRVCEIISPTLQIRGRRS